MLDSLDRPIETRSEPRPETLNGGANSWVPHHVVMKNTWFPLAHSSGVTATPVRRSIYSYPFFVWREDGRAVAAAAHPSEKSAAGNEFTGSSGRYPTMERYGYVWGWFGNPQAADPVHLPSLPFLPPNGGLPGYMLGTVRFDCSAPISLENLIDLTHADFLHANVVGDEKSESETIETFFTSETVTMVRTCIGKSVAPVMKFFSGIRQPTQHVRQVIHIYLRSHCAIAYGRFTPGDDVPLFHPCVPETRDRTRLDYAMNTSNAGFMFRHVMPKASYLVSRQDSSMTSPQSARYMTETKRRDLHSKFDAPGQRYRLLMQDLAKRQAAGDFEYRDNVSQDCSELIGLRRELFQY
jgi:phenylpropionate dioxygenase-like ring-hydroxylating dioxygenase large terminal subunit